MDYKNYDPGEFAADALELEQYAVEPKPYHDLGVARQPKNMDNSTYPNTPREKNEVAKASKAYNDLHHAVNLDEIDDAYFEGMALDDILFDSRFIYENLGEYSMIPDPHDDGVASMSES